MIDNYTKELTNYQARFVKAFSPPLFVCNSYEQRFNSRRPYFCRKLERPSQINDQLIINDEVFGNDPVGYHSEPSDRRCELITYKSERKSIPFDLEKAREKYGNRGGLY
jgi:hypothetical protein